jgi:hypothetical protein
MNELQIRLTADIKGLQSAINKAKQTLKSFESETATDSEKSNVGFRRKLGLLEQLDAKAKQLKVSLKQATNEQQIALFNAQLEQTNAEMTRLNALGKSFSVPAVKSFDNLKRSAGAASGAAIAFSRIIQDAPFGIIGVANNIQSFGEQLSGLGGKAATAGQKLSAFFSALITPANLAILAVSALTAAYQAYSLGLFDAEEETKDLRSESEKLNDSLQLIEKNLNAVDSARLQGNKGAAEELTQLELLNKVLTDVNKPYSERIRAFQLIKQGYGSQLGNMTEEKALAEGIGDAYIRIVSAINQRAAAEAIFDKIVDLKKQELGLLEKETKEFDLQQQLLSEREKISQEIIASGLKINKTATTFAGIFGDQRVGNFYIDLAERLIVVNKEFENLGNVIAPSTKASLEENKSSVESLTSEFQNLANGVEIFNTEGDKVKELVRTFEDLSDLEDSLFIADQTKINKFGESIASFFRNSRETVAGLAKPVEGASMIYTQNVEAMIQKNREFEEALNSIGLTSAQVFQAIANGAADGYGSLNEFIVDLAKSQQFFNEAFSILEAGIENTIGDVAFAIGEAFANGGNALKAGGSALLGGMAAVLNQLGQLAIQAGITIAATRKSLETLNPVFAIAAGVAMIALAGYLSAKSQALAGNFGGGGSISAGTGSTYTNKREFGGPVSKGRAYIVGERRPELFVPNTNGIIVPQLPSMDYSGASMAAGAMAVDVNIRGVSYGDDILFTVQQAQIRRGLR